MKSYYKKRFNIKVTHDRTHRKFCVPLMDTELAIHYREEEGPDNKRVWEFHEVVIPHPARRLRVAPHVLEYALEYARKRRIQIRANCSFVQTYLKQYPRYEALLAS